MEPEKILVKVKKTPIQIVSLGIFLTVLCVCVKNIDVIYWIRPIITGRNSFFTLQYFEYGYLFRLLWYVLGFVLIFALIAIVPSKKTFFTEMGERTIQVYALHRIVIYIWHAFNMDVFMQMIWPEHWKLLTVFGGGWLITYLLSSKIFSKPFKWLLNPKSI